MNSRSLDIYLLCYFEHNFTVHNVFALCHQRRLYCIVLCLIMPQMKGYKCSNTKKIKKFRYIFLFL